MKKLSFFLLFVTILFSCRENTDIIDQPIGPDPKIVVNATVYGKVTNETGDNIPGATVSFQNLLTTTDENGVFSFNDSDLFQDGTFITVQKDGYMKGSRMFYPNVSQDSHIEIQLISKQIKGTVNSSQGGKVEFDGAVIDLPENGFVSADGSDYSGDVNIVAKYLDPSKEATFREMPGDLVGVNSDNNQMALATYGMLGVELEDISGNHLQIKDGFTASITVPVPSSHIGTAPSTIPLWHFDDESGYWLEEGFATLVNGNYEGEVSHFSFWNCDAPFPLINLTGAIQINDIGYEGIKVQIMVNSNGFAACGFTSNRGYFGGKVPQDQDLTINVFDECGTIIYTENIGSFSSDYFLPTININNITSTVSISGTASNCNGDEIDNGYVHISFGLVSYTYPLNNDQSFDFTIANCNAAQAQIIVVDQSNSLSSSPLLIDITSDLNVGDLEACNEFYERQVLIDYPGTIFGLNDNTLGSFSEVVFPTKSVFTITLLNWDLGTTKEFSVVLNNGEITTDYTIDFESDGFSCSGTATMFRTLDSVTGDQMLIFKSTSTDITVTDSTIFDPSITEVVFDLGI